MTLGYLNGYWKVIYLRFAVGFEEFLGHNCCKMALWATLAPEKEVLGSWSVMIFILLNETEPKVEKLITSYSDRIFSS